MDSEETVKKKARTWERTPSLSTISSCLMYILHEIEKWKKSRKMLQSLQWVLHNLERGQQIQTSCLREILEALTRAPGRGNGLEDTGQPGSYYVNLANCQIENLQVSGSGTNVMNFQEDMANQRAGDSDSTGEDPGLHTKEDLPGYPAESEASSHQQQASSTLHGSLTYAGLPLCHQTDYDSGCDMSDVDESVFSDDDTDINDVDGHSTGNDELVAEIDDIDDGGSLVTAPELHASAEGTENSSGSLIRRQLMTPVTCDNQRSVIVAGMENHQLIPFLPNPNCRLNPIPSVRSNVKVPKYSVPGFSDFFRYLQYFGRTEIFSMLPATTDPTLHPYSGHGHGEKPLSKSPSQFERNAQSLKSTSSCVSATKQASPHSYAGDDLRFVLRMKTKQQNPEKGGGAYNFPSNERDSLSIVQLSDSFDQERNDEQLGKLDRIPPEELVREVLTANQRMNPFPEQQDAHVRNKAGNKQKEWKKKDTSKETEENGRNLEKILKTGKKLSRITNKPSAKKPLNTPMQTCHVQAYPDTGNCADGKVALSSSPATGLASQNCKKRMKIGGAEMSDEPSIEKPYSTPMQTTDSSRHSSTTTDTSKKVLMSSLRSPGSMKLILSSKEKEKKKISEAETSDQPYTEKIPNSLIQTPSGSHYFKFDEDAPCKALMPFTASLEFPPSKERKKVSGAASDMPCTEKLPSTSRQPPNTSNHLGAASEVSTQVSIPPSAKSSPVKDGRKRAQESVSVTILLKCRPAHNSRVTYDPPAAGDGPDSVTSQNHPQQPQLHFSSGGTCRQPEFGQSGRETLSSSRGATQPSSQFSHQQ